MEFQIIRPDKTQIVKVNWVEVNTPVGNFVIQHGHAPTLLTLSKGKEVVYELTNPEEQKSFVADRGVLSVTRNSVILVV